jgi:hypothetical protein
MVSNGKQAKQQCIVFGRRTAKLGVHGAAAEMQLRATKAKTHAILTCFFIVLEITIQ